MIETFWKNGWEYIKDDGGEIMQSHISDGSQVCDSCGLAVPAGLSFMAASHGAVLCNSCAFDDAPQPLTGEQIIRLQRIANTRWMLNQNMGFSSTELSDLLHGLCMVEREVLRSSC